jgi:hypothetical protein
MKKPTTSNVTRFKELCEERIHHLKGTVASKATAYVHSSQTSDQKAAKEAMSELRAWQEAFGHFTAIFEEELSNERNATAKAV